MNIVKKAVDTVGSVNNNQSFINQSFTAIFIVIASIILMPKAIAQQCFVDERQAYEYLILSQQREALASQAAIDGAWVNINTASEAELTTLAGIGPVKAQSIILYREMFGGFSSVDELTRIKGIGERTVENNRERLRVD